MNLRLSNQINMVGTCITVAQSPEHSAVWTGNEPADFGPDLTTVVVNYGRTAAKAAQADAATGGSSDAKDVAETVLEDAAHVLARALANHFKKTGNLEDLAKVDMSKSKIVALKNQDLVSKTTGIRDLGTTAQAEAGAAGRGVTAARVAALTAAIGSFSGLMNAPRGQIVNRSTLLREVETETAGLLEDVNDLDDLVLQFDGTEAGRRFIEAWRRARIIVDAGGGGGATPTPPAPTPPPA